MPERLQKDVELSGQVEGGENLGGTREKCRNLYGFLLSSYPINSRLKLGSQILFFESDVSMFAICAESCWLQIDLAALPLEQNHLHKIDVNQKKRDDPCSSTGDPQDGCAFGDFG